MTEPPHQIMGGADPEVAAAIGAVIALIVDNEAVALAQPRRPPRQSPWVLAWRPREIPAPLPSHTYDALGWSEAAEAEDDGR